MKMKKYILEKGEIESRLLQWQPVFNITTSHHLSDEFVLFLRLYIPEKYVDIALKDGSLAYVTCSANNDELFSAAMKKPEQDIFMPNTREDNQGTNQSTSYPFCYANQIIIDDKIAGLLIIYTNTDESPQIKYAAEIAALHDYFYNELKAIIPQIKKFELLQDINFQKFLDSTKRGIIATNRYEQIQYINPYAQEMLHLSTEVVHGKKCTDLLKYFNRNTRKRCLDPIKTTLQTSKPYTIPKDTMVVNLAGNELCIEGFTLPIFDKQNVFQGAFVLMSDNSLFSNQQTKTQEYMARFECEKKLSNIGYIKFDYRKNKIDFDVNSSQIILGSEKFTTLPITDFFTRIIDHEKNNEISNLVENIEKFQTPISEEILSIRTLTNQNKIINYRLQNTFDSAGNLIKQEGVVSQLDEETILRNIASIVSNASRIYFLRYMYNTGKIEFPIQMCQLLGIEPSKIQSLDQMLEYIDEYDKEHFIKWLEALLLEDKSDGIIINFLAKDNILIPIHTQRYYSGLQNSDEHALFLVFQDLRPIYNNPDFIEYRQSNGIGNNENTYNDNIPITHFFEAIEKIKQHNLSYSEQVKLFLKQTALFLKVDKIVLFVHDNETQHLDYYKEWHTMKSSQFNYHPLYFKIEEIPTTYRKLQKNEYVVITHIDDIKNTQKTDWAFFKQRATESALVIPVMIDNHLFAVLLCENSYPIKPVRDSYLNQITLSFTLLSKQAEYKKQLLLTNKQLNELSSAIEAMPHSFCVFDQNATLERIHLSQDLFELAKENEIQTSIDHINHFFVVNDISAKVAELIRQITNEQYNFIQTKMKITIENQEYVFDVECSKTTVNSFLCMFSLVHDGIVIPQDKKNQKLKKAFSLAGIGDWTYLHGQEEFIASYETAIHLGFTQELKDGYKINFAVFSQNIVVPNTETLTKNIVHLHDIDEFMPVRHGESTKYIHIKAQWYETINNKLVLQGISQDVSNFIATNENNNHLIQTMQTIVDEVFILSDNFEIIYANDAAINNYTFTDKNILFRPIQSVLTYVNEQTLEQIKAIHNNHTISLSVGIEIEPLVTKDIYLHISKIKTEEKISYLLVLRTEKTLLKQLFSNGSDKYKHLYDVFDNMPCPILIINNEKQIININIEARLFFADKSDISGLSNAHKCIINNAILPKSPNITYNETGILSYVKKHVTRTIPYRLNLLEEINKQERDYILMLDCSNNERLKLESIQDTFVPNKDKIYYILIVDDLMENYVLLKELLNIDRECKYYWAKNGQIAIDTINTNPDIELILMDIDMPIMNGIEATQEIKAQWPEIPIIMQSAYTQANERNEAHKAGCDDFIAKPTDYVMLSRKIKKMLKIYD